MKINNITAVDYHTADGQLTIVFTGTTLEAITSMDPTLVTVRTDTGDLVETYAGYALQSVTYNVEGDNYQAIYVPAVRDGTAETIKQLAAQVDELTKRLEELQPNAEQKPPQTAPAEPVPQATEPVPETAATTSQDAQ